MKQELKDELRDPFHIKTTNHRGTPLTLEISPVCPRYDNWCRCFVSIQEGKGRQHSIILQGDDVRKLRDYLTAQLESP